jgi:hypothetical protein
MSKRLYLGLGAAAASVGGIAYLLFRKSAAEVKTITTAVESKPGAPPTKVSLRLTTYWPFTAKAHERKREGGTEDRTGRPLHTLEQHKADPSAHPYVSLAGDDAIWPYGQRLIIPALGENLIFRIVDTGGNFRGPGKVIRAAGYEPIDVCVQSSATKLPPTVEAFIVPGDNFEKAAPVQVARITKGAV